MRDHEFTIIYRKLIAQLDKYFHSCLKNCRYNGSYSDMKRDLISLTGHDAFLNSRKESLSGYSIEALIWLKARNIWADFIHPTKSKIHEIDYVATKKSNDPDPLHILLVREQLERIRQKVDFETWQIIELRAEGLRYAEIAQTIDEEEGKIKMRIHRLRKRLKNDLLRFL